MDFLSLTQSNWFLVGPVAKVLGVVMNGIYEFLDMFGIASIGLAIILFTIIIKALMLPLSIKQQKGMVKMAMFRPKMEEIQKKYAKNPQKMKEELTNLYASDDMFAGSQDAELDHLMYKSDSQFDFCWDIHYKGIYAANTCLEGLDLMEAADNVPDAGLFSQRKGEACFMRAFQYYELAELFGGVPLKLSTTQETNTPRATAAEVWAQLATDLQQAISLMSDKK